MYLRGIGRTFDGIREQTGNSALDEVRRRKRECARDSGDYGGAGEIYLQS